MMLSLAFDNGIEDSRPRRNPREILESRKYDKFGCKAGLGLLDLDAVLDAPHLVQCFVFPCAHSDMWPAKELRGHHYHSYYY
eukprot:2717656-Amphidinium_carterae.1